MGHPRVYTIKEALKRDRQCKKAYVTKNRDKILARRRNAYYKNKNNPKVIAIRKKDQKNTYCKNRSKYLQNVKNKRLIQPNIRFSEIKYNAKRRNIDFCLTFNEFCTFWKKSCCYCGSEIATIGLDRVDNNVGYLIDNVVSCCGVCNWMKRHLIKEQFIHHCELVVKFSKERR